jgi:AcrR family transcriptional regulator
MQTCRDATDSIDRSYKADMPRQLVDTETIITVALEAMEEPSEGPLTARRLATRLKCSTRTLYQQMGKQEQLISALLNHYFVQKAPQLDPSLDWKGAIGTWSKAFRLAILARPNLSRHLSTENRPALIEFTRPLLAALITAQLSEPVAVEVCRSLVHVIVSLTLGELETQSHRYDETAIVGDHLTRLLSIDANAYERSPDGKTPPPVFVQSIEWLIGGIELQQHIQVART